MYPSTPLTRLPSCTPSLDYSTTQGPRQQGSWPPLPAQKWIISLFTPVSAQTPTARCCVEGKKAFPRRGGAALPKLSYICVRKWLNWTLIVLTADYAFKLDFLYALSLCILHILRGERRRGRKAAHWGFAGWLLLWAAIMAAPRYTASVYK